MNWRVEVVAEKTGVEFPTSKKEKKKLMKFYEKTNPNLIQQAVSSDELIDNDFYRKSTPARMFRTSSDFRMISGSVSNSFNGGPALETYIEAADRNQQRGELPFTRNSLGGLEILDQTRHV
ncbi:Oidioi.mRNA.OKI2018_I69.XSR.g15988.t1.cds [Oikopleura dioica]|uniref:Oidioi.mRNA.OKI2018_I69.XSR.g15988.t1.cds n=1 Tax=Oikopleura dioica TaxID=34765 RepID=A0ABN7SJQ9_OIKDI|nr:Oidioi.mRNA.OKI2018_I69.XSR.g15988.t1.cds [Oikopleura dioica]